MPQVQLLKKKKRSSIVIAVAQAQAQELPHAADPANKQTNKKKKKIFTTKTFNILALLT